MRENRESQGNYKRLEEGQDPGDENGLRLEAHKPMRVRELYPFLPVACGSTAALNFLKSQTDMDNIHTKCGKTPCQYRSPEWKYTTSLGLGRSSQRRSPTEGDLSTDKCKDLGKAV